MLKHFQLGIRLALASFPRPSQPNVLVLRSAMGLHESSVNLHERSAVRRGLPHDVDSYGL